MFLSYSLDANEGILQLDEADIGIHSAQFHNSVSNNAPYKLMISKFIHSGTLKVWLHSV
jgi:hypothetical protein